MAWPELVFERHRPEGRARFIPGFYIDAMGCGDGGGYALRVLSACDILCVAYRQHALALLAIKPALAEGKHRLRARVVEVLANVHLYEPEKVARFLEASDSHELARRVAAATPSVKAADFPTWIDEFMVHSMIHSEAFRREVASAFRRAAGARSPTEVLSQVLKWGMNLIAGEELVPPG